MNLLNLSVRNVAASKSRFALTALAVALSVAFLTATLILADSITGTAKADIADANANTGFVVEGSTIAEADGGPGEAADRLSAALPTDLVRPIQEVPGVQEAVGETVGFAKLVSDGSAVGAGTAIDEGRSWLGDSALNPYRLVDGSAPSGPDEVALTRKLARDGNVAVGDQVQVLTPTGLVDATVSGLVTYGNSDETPLARTVLFDSQVANDVLMQDGLQRIRVAVEPGADLSSTRDGLNRLGADLVVLDGADFIAARQTAVSSPFEFLSLFLLAFAAIATVAGATIIFNTLVIAIGQRRRELALMRAIGAQRAQVLRSVLIEAATLAVVATMVGIVLGVVSAGWLRQVMDLAGLSFLNGPLVTSPRTIVIALAVGLGVTIGSAWGPARVAAGAAPIEALREAAAEATVVARKRTVAGGLLLSIGVGSVVAAGLTKNAALLAGIGLLVPGLVLTGPATVSRFGTAIGPLMARVVGLAGGMAATNVARNPRRSSSTSLGLTLGVAMVAFFATLASSISGSFGDSLDRGLQSEIVVTSASPDTSTIEPSLDGRLDAVPGVTAAALALTEGAVDGEGALIGGVDEALPTLFNFAVAEGSLDELNEGGIAVWSGGEGRIPALGETLAVTLRDGAVELPVVAIFDESLASFDPPSHLISSDLFDELEGGRTDDTLFVGIRAGSVDGSVDVAATTAQVREVVAATPGAIYETRQSYLDRAGAEADAILNLVYALLGMTVVIAVLGVANTTALSISERIREIGLLRAVGTTRRTVRRVIRWEAGAVSILGTVIGMVLAIASAWAFLRAAGGATLPTFAIPWSTLVVLGVGSVLSSIAVASVPAWRAANYPALDAIASS